MRSTRVATVNVKVGLGVDRSEECLERMLAALPHVLGLVEWGRRRRRILTKYAAGFRFPRLRRRLGFTHPTTGYVYVYPLLGGIPALVDAAYAEVLACRRVPSSSKQGRRVAGRSATELLIRRRSDGRLIPLRLVHLHAHHDDPAHRAAWLEGLASAEEWAESWRGYARYVLGDINKRLLELDGLVSCWAGRKALPTGPHGGTIDHVYGPTEAEKLELVRVPSDHPLGVVAVYR